MSAVETPSEVIKWPFRQFWAFLTNFWTWLTQNLHLRDILIPAIYDTLVWLSNQVPLALGGGTPGEMIEASFVLGVATFFTGFVTGGAASGNHRPLGRDWPPRRQSVHAGGRKPLDPSASGASATRTRSGVL